MGWFRKNARDYLGEGTLQSLQGKYVQAVEILSKALELDATLVVAYLHRGIAYLELGRLEEALEDFETALRLDPQEPLGYYNRARVWWQRKDLERAEADLQRTVSLDPTYTEGWGLLAVTRSQREDVDGALAAVERAIALGHPDGYWLRALILESAGWLEGAVQAYEDCVREEKGHMIDARGRRGLVLSQLGRREEAQKELEWVWKRRCKLATESRRKVEKALQALRDEKGEERP